MAKMGKEELAVLVERLKTQAMGYTDSELALDREKALDYYFGRPFGNEITGRSAVVERSLMETVEWVMPQILRVFSSSDDLARFDPEGPEDEQLAEQESDYVNHVLMKENNGLMVLHDAIKDALLLRNGYVKRWWEEREKSRVEAYSGLTGDALAQLFSDLEAKGAKVEVLGKTERSQSVQMPDGAVVVEPVWDCRLRVTSTEGRAVIEAVPSEEVLVSARCKGDLQDTDYVGHWTTKRRGELVELGLKKDFVEGLGEYSDKRLGLVEQSRNPLAGIGDTGADTDPSMDEIEYHEAYVRVDYDGDGKAELRRVVMVGGQIPDGSEWNEEVDEVPFSYAVAVRMPHRHTGISFYDLVGDLQLIRSTLSRQMLDNVYLSNNQRPMVNGRVNMDSLMISAPGSPIVIEGMEPIANSLEFWAPTPMLQQILPVLDYWEQRGEFRTGVGRNNTILDPAVLRDSAQRTIASAMSAANQRIEMIVRLVAETLVKDMVKGVHGLLIRHQDKPKVVKMRGQWVQVDPREWAERDDLAVSVGLGMGSQDEIRQNLMLLAGIQERAAPAGVVQPENVYNLATDIGKAFGSKQAEKYFTDPTTPEFRAKQAQQQPPVDPLVQSKQVETQGKVAVESAKIQAEQQAKQADLALEAARLELDRERLALERERFSLEVAQAQVAAMPKPVEDKGPDILAVADMELRQREMGLREREFEMKAAPVEVEIALRNQAAEQNRAVTEGLMGAVAQTAEAAAAAAAAASKGMEAAVEKVAKGQREVVAALNKPKRIEIERSGDKITGAKVSPESN